VAIFVLRNAFVSIGGNNLSDHIREVSVEMTADDVDVTAMGAGGHGHLAGIRDDKFTFTAYSDFNSSLDSVVYPIFSSASGTTTVEVASNTSTASATNPVYGGANCSLLTYTPVGGAVGDAAMTPLEFVVSGTIYRRTA
jgi:hypothetical protein